MFSYSEFAYVHDFTDFTLLIVRRAHWGWFREHLNANRNDVRKPKLVIIYIYIRGIIYKYVYTYNIHIKKSVLSIQEKNVLSRLVSIDIITLPLTFKNYDIQYKLSFKIRHVVLDYHGWVHNISTSWVVIHYRKQLCPSLQKSQIERISMKK